MKRFYQDQPSLRLQTSIDRSDFSAKDTINRNTERGGFPIHCSASAHSQIGVPKQIEPVHNRPRDDHFAAFKPVRPLCTQFVLLPSIARQQYRLHPRGIVYPLDELLEEHFTF